MDQLARIREEWKAKQAQQPSLKCEHTRLDQEDYRGAQTGDWCCTQRGESMPESEWKQLGKTLPGRIER